MIFGTISLNTSSLLAAISTFLNVKYQETYPQNQHLKGVEFATPGSQLVLPSQKIIIMKLGYSSTRTKRVTKDCVRV